MAIVSNEMPQHRVFDLCVDRDNLGTDIFLNVQIPSFTDLICKPSFSTKGFGGAHREGFGFYLTTDCPGRDSPGIVYEVPPVDKVSPSPYTSLMRDPPGKQYKLPPRTLVSRMGREPRTAEKRDTELNISCLQAPGRHHVDIPIGTACLTRRAPRTFLFQKTPRLSVAEFQARIQGKSEAPPCGHYTPHLVDGVPLFSTIMQRREWEQKSFSDKQYRKPIRLKDRSFGSAERFPFRAPVPNDCSTANTHAAPKALSFKPQPQHRSIGKSRRRTSMTNHASDDNPAPGAYEVLACLDRPATKNVTQGYKTPLPGGRGAMVADVVVRRNQETGETHFLLDEGDEEAKKYHRTVQRLARAKEAEGGVNLEDKRRMEETIQDLKTKVFGRGGTAYPAIPRPPHTAPASRTTRLS